MESMTPNPASTNIHAGLDTTPPKPASDTIVPPYWQRHVRNNSSLNTGDSRRSAIQLEDHTEEDSEQSKALWARSARIDDYVIVRGTPPGIGAYVVWNCLVDTLDGGSITLRKRYSEFLTLRKNLARTFPKSEGAMPPLPPKSIISNFKPKFLEKRREGLSYFLNCILLNPEFSGSPVLKEFLFS
ncbi:Phox-like protein [Trichodelitschia bisporula]|uniref:Endosomal/vacuolar adapter protein YPT35 n=1 Tax=Trichodelitschia bisporula TaxID=703511 RepID=A0A6G1I768_9PEZI|nr:Phox-like protein [Trichodelitschia bisporula]